MRGLIGIAPEKSMDLAKKYASDAKGSLGEEVMKILFSKGTESDYDFLSTAYGDKPLSQEKMSMTDKFATYLSRLNDLEKVKKGIDLIVDFRNSIPEQFRNYVDSGFKKSLLTISSAKGKEVEDYIKKKMGE
jgi:aminopeptidase N